MKKILLVRSTPNDIDINGYNVQQVGLGKAFVDLGYDYDFVTFKGKGSKCVEIVFYEKDGRKARCIEKPRKRILRWGINMEICQKRFLSQYNLIICQEYYQYESYLIAKNSPNVVLYSGPYYNLFLPKFFSPIYDMFIGPKLNKLVKVKFVKSVLAYDFLSNKGYTSLKNVGVALDTTRFDCVEPDSQTKILMDFMRKHRCILYVGALSDRKNYPFMLALYAKLLEKVPDLKFVVIGKSVSGFWHKLLGGKDEDYERECTKCVSKQVLAGIHRIERVENPQLKFIYPLCKAFILPSKLEIFGMVLLEAMFLGAPTVTSRNGGSMTLMRNSDDFGQIVNEFDVDKWADAVLRFIEDDKYTARVKENAQNLIKKYYNWTVIAKHMLEYLKINGYDV